MKIKIRIRNTVLGCCVMATGLLFDGSLPGGGAVNEA